MDRRDWLVGAMFLALLGCTHSQTRLQKDEDADPDKEAEVKTIGSVSEVMNADPVRVSGVGLVVGLEGTGAGAPPGGYRSILENNLHKMKFDVFRDMGFESVKEVLNSPTTSLVIVNGLIPAGARKGDPIDLEVTVPQECKTRSLRGGQLIECLLYEFESKKNLKPDYTKADGLLMGKPVARAEGKVIVGFGDGDDAEKVRKGRIWAGGRCRVDRAFFIVLNSDQHFARVAKAVADRVNETFHGTFQSPLTELASAKTTSVVALSVPPQYRLNLPRYLRVVRLIPLQPGTQAERIAYRRKLEEQLNDPARTVSAALRLEALGQDSVPILKSGLRNDRPLVRFCAAEALAYLGSPSCGEELARLVREQPALRAFSLTALASLDEAVCRVELRRLLSENSAETRYGAFRALRALDEHEEAIQGEQINNSFWVHKVAPGSPGLIHVSTAGRAEVILFGDDIRLTPPFPILAGEFTVTAREDDEKCTVTRTSVQHGKRQRQCSFKFDDIIQVMGDMGCDYADVVEVVRKANELKCVGCPVAVDALPQATSVYDLARSGSTSPDLLKTDKDIINAGSEFGATPNLFEHGAAAKASK